MEGIEKKLLARFIFESDAIEGIEDNLGLLEKQIAEGKEDGHAGAMLLLESLAGDKTGPFN